MVIQLNSGQSVTIFENQNVLRQIKDYIDDEIYDLLEYKFGYLEKPQKSNEIKLIKYGEELIGKRIKYCDLYDGGELDHNIIATDDGSILMINGTSDLCEGLDAFNEDEFNEILLNNPYLREPLIENNIISKEYSDELLKKELERKDKNKQEAREREYKEYLKLKEKFEGGK